MTTHRIRCLVVLGCLLTLHPSVPSSAAELEPVAKGSFPRRLLTVAVGNYPYANPVNTGSGERSLDKVTLQFANLMCVPHDQVMLLSDKGRLNVPPSLPPVKEVIEQAITQYLDTSREQDRIMLLFVGHAVELDGVPYLMPLEGEADQKDTLIPLKWVFEKLAACRAQQKVLILDVCRFDPTRGEERGSVAPMGEKTDAMLQKPPQGVQVLTACVAGQRSLEMSGKLLQDGLVDGGIMLNQMAILNANGGIRGVEQKPDDPLPLKGLERKLLATTKSLAFTFFKVPQTPRLSGEAGKNVPFDPKAELPKGLSLKLPEIFRGGVASKDDLTAMFARVANVPPTRGKDKGGEFSVDSLPPYPKPVVGEYKDDQKDTPFRSTVVAGIEVLQRSDRDVKILEAFPALPEAPLAKAKDQIAANQKTIADALEQLAKMTEELEKLKDDRAKEDRYWQTMYTFVLSRLQARRAYLLEYNAMLSKVRKDDLPALDRQVHKGWRLASTTKLTDKEGQALADKARGLLELLAKEHKGTPWGIVAGREARISLGLEWQPN